MSAAKPEPRIVRSRARCLNCGVVVESKHRHDFVVCSCGAMFLDGGTEYVRYGYKDESRVELLTDYAPAEATP